MVDKLKEKEPKVEVLLTVDNDKVKIGQPVLPKSKVVVKVLSEEKGKKINILKYKAKSRYRKHLGFRPQYSRLLIKSITI